LVKPASNERQQKIRVALIATSVEFGGIERVLLNLVQHIGDGVELCPIVFARSDTRDTSFFDRLRAMGITPETLYVDTHAPELILNPLVNLWQAISLFRRKRFDLIHAHGYRADIFGLLLSKLCGVPAVSTCHGFVATDWRLRLYCALDVRVLRSFGRVIAVSEAMKDDLIARGLRADTVDVVTNAVTEVSTPARVEVRRDARATLGIAEREFVFGYVGRLSEEKGVEYLLQASAQVAKAGVPFRVFVVGDGGRRETLEQEARAIGLNGHVVFTGFQGNTEPWFSAMDGFVLPSLTEGTPMALLEAMASQVPVIASAVGGVPAVVRDGENGLLVPPADATRLAEAMGTLIASPSLREKLSEGGLATVRQRYGVSDWICNTRSVYMKALDQSRA
jgi:glycosyltransferase involved in cell wall biosynthesis